MAFQIRKNADSSKIPMSFSIIKEGEEQQSALHPIIFISLIP